jgi:hypothetical protein
MDIVYNQVDFGNLSQKMNIANRSMKAFHMASYFDTEEEFHSDSRAL